MGASAEPQPQPTTAQALSDLVRQLNYIFFNRKPTANPSQDPQSGTNKEIVGNLNAQSNNGYGLTYTVVTQPKYGTLTLNPDGTYTYVASADLIQPGIVDQFTVRINNGTKAAEPGALGQLQNLLHSIAIAIGVAQPDTITKTINVTVTGSGQYGNPVAAAQWWIKQTVDNDCVLIADAAIIGQLTGQALTEAQAITLGETTTSVVDPPLPMYQGSKKDTGLAGVYNDDGVALLNILGLTATGKSYVDAIKPGEAPNKATQTDGQRAISDVEAALAAGKAVAVSVDALLIINAAGQNDPQAAPEANHWVVVTGIDLSTGKVFVNDGNLDAGSTPVSLGGFMWAWQASGFYTVVASVPAT